MSPKFTVTITVNVGPGKESPSDLRINESFSVKRLTFDGIVETLARFHELAKEIEAKQAAPTESPGATEVKVIA